MNYLTNAALLLLVCIVSCKSTRNDQSGRLNDKSFTLLKATSQKWTAGTPGGGSGTDYYFDVVINTTAPLTFDSVWVDQSTHALFVSNDRKGISSDPPTFTKGDTITIRASALIPKNTQSTIAPPPKLLAGEAEIRFTVKGKKAHFIVNTIEPLPPRHHQ